MLPPTPEGESNDAPSLTTTTSQTLWEFMVTPEMANPFGTLHGGAIASAMSMLGVATIARQLNFADGIDRPGIIYARRIINHAKLNSRRKTSVV